MTPALKFDRILVALANPTAGMTSGVRRARDLAHATGASVELFNAICSSESSGSLHAAAEQFTRLEASQNRHALEQTAKKLRREEILVTTTVQTGYPVHESILRQIKLTKPDLVLIEAHKHNVFARFLLTQTDFELIRHCPVPLLIVKGHAAWRSPSILAALDPFHSKDKPSKLDEVIIGAARAFAEKTSGTLHAAHIFKPLLPYLPSVPGTTLIEVSGADKRTYEAAVRKHFYEAVARHGLPKSKAHLIGGDSMLALPELAHTLRAGLVVMGAVSRSALKRLFIGSTAEHVLDRLECDVLIVKLKR